MACAIAGIVAISSNPLILLNLTKWLDLGLLLKLVTWLIIRWSQVRALLGPLLFSWFSVKCLQITAKTCRAEDGTLSFTNSSINTLNPVMKGAALQSYSNPDIKSFEVVKVWTAPVSGTININSNPTIADLSLTGTAKRSDGANNW